LTFSPDRSEAGSARFDRQLERPMKVRIDKARCVGNARCAAVAPDLYPLDDDGYIAVEEIEVPAGQEDLARRGARACPERIIVVEE
jgi:ferredoxin